MQPLRKINSCTNLTAMVQHNFQLDDDNTNNPALKAINELLQLDTTHFDDEFLKQFNTLKETHSFINALCQNSTDFTAVKEHSLPQSKSLMAIYNDSIAQLKEVVSEPESKRGYFLTTSLYTIPKYSICERIASLQQDFLLRVYPSTNDKSYQDDLHIFTALKNFNANIGYTPPAKTQMVAGTNLRLEHNSLSVWEKFIQANPEYSAITANNQHQSEINIMGYAIADLKNKLLAELGLSEQTDIFANGRLNTQVMAAIQQRLSPVTMAISNNSQVAGLAMHQKTIAEQIHVITSILGTASEYFAPLLNIQRVGKAAQPGQVNPIVIGDLDGSFGREILAQIQAGCIQLNYVGLLDLANILQEEADIFSCRFNLEKLAEFQKSSKIANWIESISDSVIINDHAYRKIIFMGDIINDRFTCNQLSSIQLRERVYKAHSQSITYIAGNHEYVRHFADIEGNISSGYFALKKAEPAVIDQHIKNCFHAAYFDKDSNTLYSHTPTFAISSNRFATLFGTFTVNSPDELVAEMNSILANGNISIDPATNGMGYRIASIQNSLRTNSQWYSRSANGLQFGNQTVRTCHGHDGVPSSRPQSSMQICINSYFNRPFAIELGLRED